jgi:hypothetical protein
MAKALQCPNCRARYPIADLGGDPTFPCEQCGQILKVPGKIAASDTNGDHGSRPGATTVAPAAAEVSPDEPDVAAEAEAPPDSKGAKKAAKRRQRASRRAERKQAPDHVPWPLRLLAWIVALPLGAIVVVFPARRFGLLTTFDLADVIIGTGSGRYVRLGIVVALWALATAIFVQIFLVGGRALVGRVRAGRTEPGAAPEPEPEPVPAPARAPRTRRRRTPKPELEPVAAAPEAAAPEPVRPTARSSQRLRSTAGRRTGS